MEKDNLRISTNLNELSKISQGIIAKKYRLTIWQSVKGEKNLIKGNINSQILSHSKLVYGFKINNSSVVSSKHKIYMFCEEMNVLIKGEVKIISRGRLKVNVDKKFYMKENRKYPRLNLESKDLYATIFRRMDLKESQKEEQVKMKDLSDSGCGFYITPSRAVFFQPDSKLELTAIDSYNFHERKLSGKIMHITPVRAENSLNNKMLLVGVEFDEK
ncbi:MAG: PilZ domain-containing protein, partial [Halobacteriovoraceae bacterium]|nr:PilZ domain-containing protein [Halobacteriovoraceae bacterium]